MTPAEPSVRRLRAALMVQAVALGGTAIAPLFWPVAGTVLCLLQLAGIVWSLRRLNRAEADELQHRLDSTAARARVEAERERAELLERKLARDPRF